MNTLYSCGCQISSGMAGKDKSLLVLPCLTHQQDAPVFMAIKSLEMAVRRAQKPVPPKVK